ncbi:methyltransferase [Candidatus Woesearchaeota archaeon]|nr:methyltransferase [Candidatus Woesearchaeota archaeon]
MKRQQLPQSKSKLAIVLSKLAVFEKFGKQQLLKEQYATDSEAAAEAIWFAYMNGDIEKKVVADFGCGTGLLGIAALLLGAGKVYFVDSDKDAIVSCGKNIAEAAGKEDAAKAMLMAADIADFHSRVDTVVQNPPFGTKTKHADRQFLLQAFKVADTVYSFHKIETADFVKKIAADNGFNVTNILPLQLQLKRTYDFHSSRMRLVEIGLFRIERA